MTWFLTVIETPGRTPDCSSWIVPEICPALPCASAGPDRMESAMAMQSGQAIARCANRTACVMGLLPW